MPDLTAGEETTAIMPLGPGVVTHQWVIASNGAKVDAHFCAAWFVVPTSWRGTDRFCLIAGSTEKPLAVIPGCRFEGFVSTSYAPANVAALF